MSEPRAVRRLQRRRRDTFPGAPEVCDGVSQDCDAATDEGLPDLVCFRDQDGDGFPGADIRVSACACPDGFAEERPDGRFDCADGEAQAFPGQEMFFATSYPTPDGPSFDYDCNGEEELRWPERRECDTSAFTEEDCVAMPPGFGRPAGSTGWEPPGCGEVGPFFNDRCILVMGLCISDRTTLRDGVQECR